jgi:meso-butanediol dehydrogenase / (S,S)-butanediol dehydrogenase / diacetyl reductase
MGDKGLAVVTGAASGIGQATAIRLASDGFVLSLVDLDSAGLEATAKIIEDAGSSVSHAVVDITDPDAVNDFFATVSESRAPLRALANVAGIYTRVTLMDLDRASWDKVNDVNVHGTLNMIRSAVPTMSAAGGGAIVNVSSGAAFSGRPTQPHYSAGKAAIVSLTQSAAVAFIGQNIRVNAIAPGIADTDMWNAGGKGISGAESSADVEAFQASVVARLPIKRVAEVSEMASVISFLVSDDASYVIGQTIRVCGGISATDIMAS